MYGRSPYSKRLLLWIWITVHSLVKGLGSRKGVGVAQEQSENGPTRVRQAFCVEVFISWSLLLISNSSEVQIFTSQMVTMEWSIYGKCLIFSRILQMLAKEKFLWETSDFFPHIPYSSYHFLEHSVQSRKFVLMKNIWNHMFSFFLPYLTVFLGKWLTKAGCQGAGMRYVTVLRRCPSFSLLCRPWIHTKAQLNIILTLIFI